MAILQTDIQRDLILIFCDFLLPVEISVVRKEYYFLKKLNHAKNSSKEPDLVKYQVDGGIRVLLSFQQ